MFKKNNVWIGLAYGLILPAIGFLLVEFLKSKLYYLAKADLLYIGCVAINLWLLKIAYQKNADEVAKGIISATFLCAFIFFYYKFNQA